ncbi:hypothetical protein Unana1_07499 [Umbelopsis nana]
MYNCSSDHPGTLELISATLLNSGISKIEFQPLSAQDIDFTVKHYSHQNIIQMSSGDVGLSTGAEIIHGLDGYIPLYDGTQLIQSLYNVSEHSGVLQGWTPEKNPSNAVLNTILGDTSARINIGESRQMTSPGLPSSCSYEMGPTDLRDVLKTIHVTNACSELYITPNQTSTVVNIRLNMNIFMSNYSNLSPYLQNTGWGDILGVSTIAGTLGSFRQFPNSTFSNPLIDTRYLWSVVNTTNGIDIKFCRLVNASSIYNVVDWKISYKAYSLNTGLNSDGLWYSNQEHSFIWPSDTPGKAPNYVLLGKSAIRDYIPYDGLSISVVPALDYGDPYPLPPTPEVIKFMFNANWTIQNTTSYAYVSRPAVRVDLPLYLAVLLAIFMAVAIVGLYLRKRPAVRYFDWPLLKLVAATAATGSKAYYGKSTNEVSYNVVVSEKTNRVGTIVNGGLLVCEPPSQTHDEELFLDESHQGWKEPKGIRSRWGSSKDKTAASSVPDDMPLSALDRQSDKEEGVETEIFTLDNHHETNKTLASDNGRHRGYN